MPSQQTALRSMHGKRSSRCGSSCALPCVTGSSPLALTRATASGSHNRAPLIPMCGSLPRTRLTPFLMPLTRMMRVSPDPWLHFSSHVACAPVKRLPWCGETDSISITGGFGSYAPSSVTAMQQADLRSFREPRALRASERFRCPHPLPLAYAATSWLPAVHPTVRSSSSTRLVDRSTPRARSHISGVGSFAPLACSPRSQRFTTFGTPGLCGRCDPASHQKRSGRSAGGRRPRWCTHGTAGTRSDTSSPVPANSSIAARRSGLKHTLRLGPKWDQSGPELDRQRPAWPPS